MTVLQNLEVTDKGATFSFALEDGSRWAYLAWDRATNVIGGFIGENSEDQPAHVRVHRFTHPSLQESTAGSLALYMFLQGVGLECYTPDMVGRSKASQMDIWDSFLADNGAAPPEKSGDARATVVIEKEVADFFIREALARPNEDAISFRRSRNLIEGGAISGFEALGAQKRVAQVFPVVGEPPALNIQAARLALKSVGRPSSSSVAYYGTLDPDLSRLRMQAAQAFPIMAQVFAQSGNLRAAIDKMESYQEGLMARTGLTKAGLKRLSKIRAAPPAERLFQNRDIVGEDAVGVTRQHMIDINGTVSLDQMLRELAKLPPDRVPADDANWQAYHDLLACAAIPLENLLGIPVEKTLLAAKGDWVGYMKSLSAAADIPEDKFDRRALALTMIDALEAIERFSTTALLPLMLRTVQEERQQLPRIGTATLSKAFKAAGVIALGDSKNIVGSLCQLARRYATRVLAVEDALTDPDQRPMDVVMGYGEEEFPILTEDFRASNGRVVMVMKNFDDAREDSRRNSICVGYAYLGEMKSCGSHIYSVRSPDLATTYTTLQLRSDKVDEAQMPTTQWRRTIRNVQHRGLGNCQPDPASVQAVEEFLAAVHNGQINVNRSEIDEWRRLGITKRADAGHRAREDTLGDLWNGVLGLQFQPKPTPEGTHDFVAAGFEVWKEIIGGGVARAPHLGGLWRFEPARKLIADMDPITAQILTERARDAKKAQEAQPAADELAVAM